MINHWLKKYNGFIVYFFLVIIAIIPCLIMLNKGYIWGHDNAFHYAQIQDLYDAIKAHNFTYYLNYETANYLGVGVRIMYGSFSHLITAIIGILITPLGLSLTAAMKIVIVASVILSSIFSYKLIYRITSNQIASIVGVAIYVLFPYRFCLIYVRNAYAEMVALGFVPIVFLGVNGIIHNISSSTKPYIQVVVGMTLLILTHNITAFYTAFFVIIYAVFYYKKLFKCLKDKRFYFNIAISIMLIFFMSNWFLLPLLEAKHVGLYRVFDSEAMRTGLDSIIDSSKSSLAYYKAGLNFRFTNNIFFFSFLGLLLSAVLEFGIGYLKEKRRGMLIGLIISSSAFLTVLIISFFNNVNYIIYTSMIIVVCAYIIPFKSDLRKDNWYDLIVYGVLSFITIILIFVGKAWKILPSIFYNIQFSWRLFGFLGLFLGTFTGIAFANVKTKLVSVFKLVCGFTVACFFVMMKPISTNEYNYSDEYCWSEKYSIKKENTYYMYSTGWQLEYFTTEFFDSNVLKSRFWWEIYYNYLAVEENGNAIDHPGLISGSAKFSNYKYDEGTITFDLICEKESVIEVARVYYKGYHISIKTDDGNIYELEAFDNESYVAFKTALSGEVTVYYEKTPAMNAGICLSYIAFICFIALTVKSRDYDTEWY